MTHVAQPLANSRFEPDAHDRRNEGYAASDPFTSSLDEAATRIELAFSRLEGAVANARASHHSLKADYEKLNHLLQGADEEILRLRDAIHHVTGRLDHTIGRLEALEA